MQEITYPKDELREVLEKTLGVPLFQEQAMRLAIVAAKFTGAEADELRRAMAAWKRGHGLDRFEKKFIAGMINNGYERDFAERCFRQIRGFGEYGFPESHAASFALLVYASAWIKRHHPAAFAAALLNSQPMGFYAPAQIVRDAREHGVDVRPVCVNASQWDCTLEPTEGSFDPPTTDKRTWGRGGPALRLGFRQIKGIRRESIDRLIAARQTCGGKFTRMSQLYHLAGLSDATLQRLAEADAFTSMNLSRRMASWQAMALKDKPHPLDDPATEPEEVQPLLPLMPAAQEVVTDYATIGLSLKRHPVSFAREELSKHKIIPAAALADDKRYPHGRWVSVAGLVLVRQRPGTASGVVFVTIEDETGIANLILWSHIYEHYRRHVRYATLLRASGYVQREGQVIHILAKRLVDRSDLLQGLAQPSRDFH